MSIRLPRRRRRHLLTLSALFYSLGAWSSLAVADVPQLDPVQTLTIPRFCNPLCSTSDSALDGNTAMLPGSDNSVAVYRRGSDGEWVYRQTLRSPSLAEGLSEVFGRTIALSGDLAILTGDFYDAEGNQTGSRIYVFHRTRGAWHFVQRVTLPFQNSPEADFFLWNIELSGKNALMATQVFTPLPDSPGGSQSRRHVYAFRWDHGRLRRESEVLPSDAPVDVNSFYGVRVELDGNTAFITGAPQNNGPDGLAVVRAFERVGHKWQQRQVLRAVAGGGGGFFGLTLSIHGDRAAISAPYTSHSTWYQGAVFVYRRHHGVWQQEQKLVNPAASEFPTPGDFINFGVAQDIARNNLVIENTTSPLFHSARLFKRNIRSQQWQEAARLGQPGTNVYDVHVQGSTALVMEYALNSSLRASFYRLPRFVGSEEEPDVTETPLEALDEAQ